MKRIPFTSQTGFTLIELMIAMTIGLFLLGGLVMMVQSTRNAFGTQNQLAQLQDNERLVMTFMAEIAESAGYFPNPHLNSITVFNTNAALGFTGQQTVSGTHDAVLGDTVTIRYAAINTDKIFNCLGYANTTTAIPDVSYNKFWVDSSNANNPVLTCTVNSGTVVNQQVPLVNGVQKLQIMFGVNKTGFSSTSCAETYLYASAMVPADWQNVCSLKVATTFSNPVTPANPITITRVIAVMNNAGIR